LGSGRALVFDTSARALRASQTSARLTEKTDRKTSLKTPSGEQRAFALTRLQIARCSPLGDCFQIFPFYVVVYLYG